MQLPAGARLGPYEILSALGKGGMGEVYRANDTRLRRTVAIKILPPDKVSDGERQRRFLQEARAASALNHPNIVTLHDFAEESGIDYLVLEYVAGKSLDQLITARGLPVADALEYARQIAGALAAAHAAGIIHRDIKPANVIVTPEGQVKILDFGLAKLEERGPGPEGETKTQQAALTEAGSVMGTIAYMSPEQAGGRPIDYRSDIFSLGVMLYEMLTGARPFRAPSPVETMNAIIHDPAPPTPDLPAEIEDVLAKALAKEPKDRYQHAGDFALDLRRILAAWQLKTLPSMRSRPAAIAGRRWERPVAITVVVVVALAAAWLEYNRASHTFQNPLDGAKFSRLTDFEGSELEAEISPDGKFAAFLSDRDGPFDVWLTQVGTGRFLNLSQGKLGDLLEPTRSTGFSGDGAEVWLRGFGPSGAAPTRLAPLMGGPPRPFIPNSVSTSWSHDGNRIVYHAGSPPGDPIFVADRTGANSKQIFIDPIPGGHCHFPVWSTDDRWIYFVRGPAATLEMDVWRIAPSGGPPERLTDRNTNIGWLAPINTRTLLYTSPAEDGSGPWLYSLDLESKTSRRISYGLEQYLSVAASANGRRLVATVANPSARLWTAPITDRTAAEADVRPYDLPMVRALAPRFGGGSLFYLSSLGGGDGLWRYREGQTLEIWRGSEGPLFDPAAISPDGRRIAVVLRGQGKGRLYLMSEDGTGRTPVADTLDPQGTACWSPDGKWIAAGGQDSKGPGLFKIPVEGGAPIRLSDKPAFNPAWSPDGKLIIYTGPAVSRYQPLRAVQADGGAVNVPEIHVRAQGQRYRFLPNGKGLVYMDGLLRRQNFAVLDLTTMKSRTIVHLDNPANMQTFDITPDGKQIVFDRLRENSDIVVIDLAK